MRNRYDPQFDLSLGGPVVCMYVCMYVCWMRNKQFELSLCGPVRCVTR